jgi:hypothetical protein
MPVHPRMQGPEPPPRTVFPGGRKRRCQPPKARNCVVAPGYALWTSPAEAAGGAGRHPAASRCRQPARRSLGEGGLSPHRTAEPASSEAQCPVLLALFRRRERRGETRSSCDLMGDSCLEFRL